MAERMKFITPYKIMYDLCRDQRIPELEPALRRFYKHPERRSALSENQFVRHEVRVEEASGEVFIFFKPS